MLSNLIKHIQIGVIALLIVAGLFVIPIISGVILIILLVIIAIFIAKEYVEMHDD